MKISVQWLREWVATRLDATALADRLTLAGLEVGSVMPAAERLDRIVVGRIENVAPHPEADRLRVCRVSVGKKTPLTIVCGAANAAPGLNVPTALAGATLPGGKSVTTTEIRGVRSEGMLCSASELGLEESSEGLLVLDKDTTPGTSLSLAMRLDDHVLEVELTPNRGDCLSVMGLARDVSAITGARYRPLSAKKPPVKSSRKLPVKLSAKLSCARYAGRAVESISTQVTTPVWMRERLRRSGIRCIHPVVDITNYVMIELGQPMHAFDLDRLTGGLNVRQAAANESIELLDGKMLELSRDDLVIADSKRAVALAGIMGGQASAVGPETVNLFLESAWFRPDAIGVRARHYGLHSESSHRFERGVDPGLQRAALERATSLILQICGGRAGPITESAAKGQLPRRKAIVLQRARLERILGIAIPDSRISGIFRSLGMQSSRRGGAMAASWSVTPPSWRFDITGEEDLVEELARIYGYDRIVARTPSARLHIMPVPESRIAESRLLNLLVDREYQEAITYSFVDPALQAAVVPGSRALALANPIASDLAEMRVSLWPGLIQAAQFNLNRQQERVRLFEIGRRFLPAGDGITTEEKVLAGIACGSAHAEQWGYSGRPVDYFDVKGDVEALLQLTGQSYHFSQMQYPGLHPGQASEIRRDSDGKTIGKLGVIHPDLQKKIGLDCSAIVFEINLAALQAGKLPEFHEISRFPAIRRDIAIVLDEAIPARDVMDLAQKTAGRLLINLELFDEYRGEGIDSGRKSLALGLTFQDTSRTLSNEDVEVVVGRVVAALQAGFDAQPRQ